MNINRVQIQNFRKLKRCHIDFSATTTMFVGANNSGKTSAMDALRKFLTEKQRFSFNDFTICNHAAIRKIGESWLLEAPSSETPLAQWTKVLPTLDVWLNVDDSEIQYVAHLIPTLKWSGGLLGVRFLFQPKNPMNLYADYKEAYEVARTAENEAGSKTVSLWPKSLCDYLEREGRLGANFTLKAYILDPAKAEETKPQDTDFAMECITQDPLNGLIQIDIIEANRDLVEVGALGPKDEKIGKLSSQLRSYYDKHLDLEVAPSADDIKTLTAMEAASTAFNTSLTNSFTPAINELKSLGYPGVNDPDITVVTKISAADALRHDSAVQYSLGKVDEEELRLPERYSGLGYQNLISIVFRLMQFRDGWIKRGKAKSSGNSKDKIAPLHLVLLEEPEAHLHVQVQQVFIRKAYGVLRNSSFFKSNKGYKTQLVVSTHSSHIAKEADFADLRYFKRLLPSETCDIATAEVINLKDVFGAEEATAKFAARYLKATHCDLFFADAAILVEGAAENMLLPHFIRNSYEELSYRYISILSIDGRHSYRLRPLLDRLCLTTLIITDIDSVDPANNNKSAQPVRKQGLISSNYAITDWLIQKKDFDELLALPSEQKVFSYTNPYPYNIRIAYQTPIEVDYRGKNKAISRTFEDSIVYSNLTLFTGAKGAYGLVGAARELISDSTSFEELHKGLYEKLRSKSTDKASFALDLIFSFDPKEIIIPEYIAEGLKWLEGELDGESYGG